MSGTVPRAGRRARRLGGLAGVAILLAGLFVSAPAAAQSAQVTVDRDRVELDDDVVVELTVRGGRGRQLRAPAVTCCLRLVSPRPFFDVSSTVNGETERTVSWRYRAIRPGDARILSDVVEVGGRTVRTQPVDVEITAAAPAPAPRDLPAGDLFVRAEASRTTAVVGQQVFVDYVLYFDPSIQPRQTTPTGTWDAPGAWREELDVPPAYPRTVQRGGQTLESVTIRRVALFPTRAGALELAPMDFAIDLFREAPDLADDPFGSFFRPFASTFDEEDVTAPGVTIDVAPLPAGAPPSFSGAVGQFGLATSVEPRRVTAGDPVEVRLTLTGTGNLATLPAPALDVPTSVDVYDPSEELDLDRKADPLRGRKTFSYTLVPQAGGTLDLPPAVWSYYDPSDGRYKTLRSDAVEITVDGPALAARPAPNASGLLTEADWRAAPRASGWLWWVLGGGLALPALALLGLAVARAGRERRRADTPARRAARATPEVRRRLAAARPLDGPPFYAALDDALRQFLADRLGVPRTARSRADVERALRGRSVPAPLRERVDALLQAAERGQFAPGAAPDREATLAETEQVLDALGALQAPRRGRRQPDEAAS